MCKPGVHCNHVKNNSVGIRRDAIIYITSRRSNDPIHDDTKELHFSNLGSFDCSQATELFANNRLQTYNKQLFSPNKTL